MATTQPPKKPAAPPIGQPFPARLMMPLVALHVGAMSDYISANMDYAETILQSVSSEERSVIKDAITTGRNAISNAAKLRKDAPLITDSKAIQEQSKLMCEAMQALNGIGEIVVKNFTTGTLINNRLIAKIVVSARTNRNVR